METKVNFFCANTGRLLFQSLPVSHRAYRKYAQLRHAAFTRAGFDIYFTVGN